MMSTRQRGTKPEQLIRDQLDALGLKYEVDRSPIPGLRSRADIVFAEANVAVFIDGCFWHGCPIHATWPKSNGEYWKAKIEANRRRDERTKVALADAGWLVLRFWAHDDPAESARAVTSHVKARLAIASNDKRSKS